MIRLFSAAFVGGLMGTMICSPYPVPQGIAAFLLPFAAYTHYLIYWRRPQ